MIDLAGVTFIDSTGLAALVKLEHGARRARRAAGDRVPASGPARLLLDVTGLAEQLAGVRDPRGGRGLPPHSPR